MEIPDSLYQFIGNLPQLLGTYIYLLERFYNFLCSIVGFFVLSTFSSAIPDNSPTA